MQFDKFAQFQDQIRRVLSIFAGPLAQTALAVTIFFNSQPRYYLYHFNLKGILIVNFSFYLGNVLYKDWDNDIAPPNQCTVRSELDPPDDSIIGVEARNYTPYYYFVMGTIVIVSVCFTTLMNPTMRRSTEDENKNVTA